MEMHQPRLRYTAKVAYLGRTDWPVSHVPYGNYAMSAIQPDLLGKRLYQYERFLHHHQTDSQPTFRDRRIDSTSVLLGDFLV